MSIASENERSRLVGRTRELAAIREALKTPGVVTLLGPGGVGKTRLAREIVLDDEAPPVLVVWLDEVERGRDVNGQTALALGLPQDADVERIVEALERNPEAVLFLDNAEHVVGAVRALVERVPTERLRVLVTSREPLGAPGEAVIVVEPLAAEDGAALMVEQAGRVGTELAESVAATLSSALDGLPLAIELAASRLSIVSPEQLLTRLRSSNDIVGSGSSARHGTLDRTIAWSWDLLSDEERKVAATVAWFDTPLAPEVVAALWEDLDVWTLAQELQHKSWLRVVDTQYGKHWHTLWAMRRFLDAELADALRAERHRRVVLWAERHVDETPGWWAEHVAAGLAAVDALMELGPYEVAARVLSRTFFGAFGTSAFARTSDTAAELLRRWPPDEAPEVWAHLAAQLAKGSFRQASGHAPRGWAKAGWETAGKGTAARVTAGAQYFLCLVDDGERERLDELLAELLEDAERLPDDMSTASSLLDVGTSAHEVGRHELAREVYERVQRIAGRAGDADLQARSWIHMSYVSYDRGEFERARQEIRELDRLMAHRHPHERLAIGGAIPPMVELQLGHEAAAVDSLRERAALARDARYLAMEFFVTLGFVEWASRCAPDEIDGHLDHAFYLARLSASAKSLAHTGLLAAVRDLARGEPSTALQRIASLRRGRPPGASVRWGEALDAFEWFARGSEGAAPDTPVGRLLAAVVEEVEGAESVVDAFVEGCDPALWNVPGIYMLRLDDAARYLVRGRVGARPDRAALVVDVDGKWADFEGERYDLRRRGPLRRILVHLVRARLAAPGEPVSVDDLVEVGWPGERIVYEAAQTRVYTTMNRLRKLPFGEVVVTLEGGYAIPATVSVQIREDPRRP